MTDRVHGWDRNEIPLRRYGVMGRKVMIRYLKRAPEKWNDWSHFPTTDM